MVSANQQQPTSSRRGRKPGFRLPPPSPPTGDIVRPNQQHFVTGISKATAYRLMAAGQFPRHIKLTPFISGWRRSDLESWVASRQISPEKED